MKTEKIKVKNMTCSGCEMTVKNALSQIPGVHTVETSLADATVTVAFEGSDELRDKFRSVLEDFGYPEDINS